MIPYRQLSGKFIFLQKQLHPKFPHSYFPGCLQFGENRLFLQPVCGAEQLGSFQKEPKYQRNENEQQYDFGTENESHLCFDTA